MIRILEVARIVPVNGVKPHTLATIGCMWEACENTGHCYLGSKKNGGVGDGVAQYTPRIGLDDETLAIVCMDYRRTEQGGEPKQ